MASSMHGGILLPSRVAFVRGHSATIQTLNALVEEIAPTNIPVLLEGESGTGKEVYGRVIHQLSRISCQPLKKVNCRAFEQGEALSALKAGFQNGGGVSEIAPCTLFLDSADELDLGSQNALLSFLPDGDGEDNAAKCLRTITSTSRNLEKEVESGRFRRELYFRINGVCLHIPPLRDRKEDIPILMEHFLAKHASEAGRSAPVLRDKEKEILHAHKWPGNVRELENLARRIVALGDSGRVIEELGKVPEMESANVVESRGSSLKVAARAASRRIERDLIARALERTHWNRKRAAQELQISYKSLLYKIKQTGLEEEQKERG